MQQRLLCVNLLLQHFVLRVVCATAGQGRQLLRRAQGLDDASTSALVASTSWSRAVGQFSRRRLAAWLQQAYPARQSGKVTFVSPQSGNVAPSLQLSSSVGGDGPRSRAIINIAEHRNWTGFGVKLESLHEFLKTRSFDELVAFVDGDAFWGGCACKEFQNAYDKIVQQSLAPIVFGAEMTCWEQDCRQVPSVPRFLEAFSASDDFWSRFSHCPIKQNWTAECAKRRRCHGCSNPPALKFLNSGFFIGPAGKLLVMVEWALANYRRYSTFGDQSVYAAYWLMHPSEVTLDYEARLVLNLSDLREEVLKVSKGVVWNNAFDRPQCLIHPNGRGKAVGKAIAERLGLNLAWARRA